MKKYFLLPTAALLFTVACTNAPEGQKTTTTAPVETQPPAAPNAETYTVNTSTSRLNWQGTEPSGEGHTGTIGLKNGTLQVSGGVLSGGSFELDINSIAVTDLTGGSKTKLETHLKNADFFDAGKFPTGRFVITKVEPLAGQADATHRISGNLTLRDSTHNISFPAKITLTAAALSATTPKFTIDRIKWGVVHRSGLLGTVKDKLIHDEIGLSVQLEAAK